MDKLLLSHTLQKSHNNPTSPLLPLQDMQPTGNTSGKKNPITTNTIHSSGRLTDFEHVNINQAHDEQSTRGQRVADKTAATMGSWAFILVQSAILIAWIMVNSLAFVWFKWDAYPYILLNLCLSFQAAFATPIILMSQNRQAQKDRIAAEQDYKVNLKGEQEVVAILGHLAEQDETMMQILGHLDLQDHEMGEMVTTLLEHLKQFKMETKTGKLL